MLKMLVWESHGMISGGQKMTLMISDLMRNQIHSVYIIPEKGALSDSLDEKDIHYYLMGDQKMTEGIKSKWLVFKYLLLSVRAIGKGLFIVLKEKPDFIYAPGPAALPWATICGSLTNTSVIWHLHHVFLDASTKKLISFFSKWPIVKKIIAVSNCVAEQITNKIGSSKTEILYNPVDIGKYENGDGKKIEVEFPLLKQNKVDRSFVIGQVALMQETKRQTVVIDTVYELISRGYDVKCLLVGGTKHKEDEIYLDEIIEKVKHLGLEDEIILLGHRKDVHDILQVIDFLMIPSAFEGFPLAGLEANSAKVPVVCANVGGSAEYAKVSGGGVEFDFDDPISAANSIINSLLHYENLQENGYQFSSKCSLENYKESIKTAFKF